MDTAIVLFVLLVGAIGFLVDGAHGVAVGIIVAIVLVIVFNVTMWLR